MSYPNLTPTGIKIQTFQEIFDELATSYRNIYGQDINLDQNSPDGQRVGIEAKKTLDIQSYCLAMYNALDPDFAQGLQIDKIAKLSGTFRRPATRSSVDVNVVVDRPINLNTGWRAIDDFNQIWVLGNNVSLVVGVNKITLLAQNFGAVEAPIGTINRAFDIVVGVTNVYNDMEALVGTNEETDVEIRNRRNRSLALPGYSTVLSLLAELYNTAGVRDVVVYENDQSTPDIEKDMGPHSIWCVVEGGEISDIVETIAKQKTAGTALKGSVERIFNETFTSANGTIRTIPHLMRFDRPQLQELYIKLKTTRKISTQPVDIELMKQKLTSATFIIGQSVQANALYTYAFQAGTNFILTDLGISLDNINFTDGTITPFFDGKIVIKEENINIEEIII